MYRGGHGGSGLKNKYKSARDVMGGREFLAEKLLKESTWKFMACSRNWLCDVVGTEMVISSRKLLWTSSTQCLYLQNSAYHAVSY